MTQPQQVIYRTKFLQILGFKESYLIAGWERKFSKIMPDGKVYQEIRSVTREMVKFMPEHHWAALATNLLAVYDDYTFNHYQKCINKQLEGMLV